MIICTFLRFKGHVQIEFMNLLFFLRIKGFYYLSLRSSILYLIIWYIYRDMHSHYFHTEESKLINGIYLPWTNLNI